MLEYYGIWNLFTLLIVGLDKYRARRSERRIRERSFFIAALLFGAAGILAGMYLFRHKTRHRSFTVGIPVLLILNILGLYLMRY